MPQPRKLDLDKAIVTATELFWRKGYDGTSLTDLTKAMKTTAPSFYFAFENKENLFKRVLAYYQATHITYFAEALNMPTAKTVAERLLYGFADGYTDSKHPTGCMALNCSLPVTNSKDPVRQALAEAREMARTELTKRLKKAKASGDLSRQSDPDGLARYLLVVGYGMAVEAQSGASRKDLHCTVETALGVFSQFHN